MSIDFTKERWQKVKDTSKRWWSGELKRPIIHARLKGNEPDRDKPVLPDYDFSNFFNYDQPELFDFSVKPELIVDRWDYNLCCTEFAGDAFPLIWPNFGAGINNAFLGAELNYSGDTVWFKPPVEKKIEDLHFEFDRNNKWLQRVCDILKAAKDRWQDNVMVLHPDIGGTFDILSAFRGAENLMFDMYDKSDEVHRAAAEIRDTWFKYYDLFEEILNSEKDGRASWACIYSDRPHYIYQCDFAFMLSPDLFEEFVKPDLEAVAEKLPNGIYHLDGKNQLNFLDSIMEIDNYKCIEWVPGAGEKDVTYWPEVYRKIQSAGKRNHIFDIQANDGYKCIEKINEQLESLRGFAFIIDTDISNKDEIIEILDKYNVLF